MVLVVFEKKFLLLFLKQVQWWDLYLHGETDSLGKRHQKKLIYIIYSEAAVYISPNKKAARTNFAKFTRKQMCRNVQLATLFEMRSGTGLF